AEIDPPAERVEAAAFVARGLADELQRRLAARGSACTRLVVGAETEHGETHERVWRTEGTFTPRAIAERGRWQLDGWLHVGAHRPTGALTRLWLAPDEIVPAGGRQLAFSAGGPGSVDPVEAGERVARSLARVQGLLGVEAVRVPEWRGGRGPAAAGGPGRGGGAPVWHTRPGGRRHPGRGPGPGVAPAPRAAPAHAPPAAGAGARAGAGHGARPAAAGRGARRRRAPGAGRRPGRGERAAGDGGHRRAAGRGRGLGRAVALRRAVVGPGAPPPPGPPAGG